VGAGKKGRSGFRKIEKQVWIGITGDCASGQFYERSIAWQKNFGKRIQNFPRRWLFFRREPDLIASRKARASTR
jgi:hypothetical protein